MDTVGHFSKSVKLEEDLIAIYEWQYSWNASPDLSLIEVFAQDALSSRSRKKLFARHTFNPKTGTYDARRFELEKK